MTSIIKQQERKFRSRVGVRASYSQAAFSGRVTAVENPSITSLAGWLRGSDSLRGTPASRFGDPGRPGPRLNHAFGNILLL